MKRKHASILFLAFNRPDATAKVFKTIKEAKPKRLYVAVDGPRFWINGEFEQVAKVKKIATSVDWPCKVTTLFRKENLGVKYAISDAITWFFKYEREGIILEDDCVPVSNFFPFCEKLLDYYRNEKKVFAISGCNIKNNLKCDNESYHFSKYFHPWGWATWRRAWNHYDNEISFWPKWKKSRDWTLKMPIKAEQIIFEKFLTKNILINVKITIIGSWLLF